LASLSSSLPGWCFVSCFKNKKKTIEFISTLLRYSEQAQEGKPPRLKNTMPGEAGIEVTRFKVKKYWKL